jgi:hypothetical protein
MARDDEDEDEIAARVAELKAKATPDAIRRMTALFEAELARRAAARKSAARPTASLPAAKPEPPARSHAMDVLRRWRPKR